MAIRAQFESLSDSELQELLPVLQQSDLQSAIKVISLIAERQFNLANWDAALVWTEKLYDLGLESELFSVVAQSCLDIANILVKKSKRTEALKKYEEASHWFERENLEFDLIWTAIWHFNCLIDLNLATDAIQVGKKAFEISKITEFFFESGLLALMIAETYFAEITTNLNRELYVAEKMALEYAEEALICFQNCGNPRRESKALSLISAILEFSGKYSNALNYLDDAIEILTSLSDKCDSDIENLAWLLIKKSRLIGKTNARDTDEEAAPLLTALELLENLENGYLLGRTMMHLGLHANCMKRHEAALIYFNQAEDIFISLENVSWVTKTYFGKADALWFLGRNEESLDVCYQILQRSMEIDEPLVGFTIKLAALNLEDLENWSEMLEVLNKMDAIVDSLDLNQISDLEYLRCVAMFKLGMDEDATQKLNSIVHFIGTHEDSFGLANALLLHGDLVKEQDPDLARIEWSQAFEIWAKYNESTSEDVKNLKRERLAD